MFAKHSLIVKAYWARYCYEVETLSLKSYVNAVINKKIVADPFTYDSCVEWQRGKRAHR